MRAPPMADELGMSSDMDSDEEPVGGLRSTTPGGLPERTDSAYY